MNRLIASWFGTGLILRRLRGSDIGSGTVGAVFAGIVAYLLYQQLDWPWQIMAAALLILIGVWAVRPLADREGDAGWIVIDEATGVFVALIGLEHLTATLVAFAVFRAADIFKTFFPGVGRADRATGPVAIIADDVVAGVYGLVAGHVVQALV